MKKNNLEETKNVTVHSAVMQMENRISEPAQDAWFELLNKCSYELAHKEEFSISVIELLERLGHTHHDYKFVESFLKELMSNILEFNVLGKDKKNYWEASTLLAYVSVKNGIITWQYSPFLRKKLQEPEMFARLNLMIQSKLKGNKSAKCIYRMLIDYFIPTLDKTEKIVSVKDLKKILGLHENEYSEFKIFNRDLLKKAIKMINEKTNINIDYELLKDKRKVTAIKFIVTPKVKLNLLAEKVLELEKNSIDKKEREINYFKNETLNKFLIENKINLKYSEAKKSLDSTYETLHKSDLSRYLEEYLLFLAEYIQNEFEKGRVKSIGGLFLKLINDERQIAVFKLLKEKEKELEVKILYKKQAEERLFQIITQNINTISEELNISGSVNYIFNMIKAELENNNNVISKKYKKYLLEAGFEINKFKFKN